MCSRGKRGVWTMRVWPSGKRTFQYLCQSEGVPEKQAGSMHFGGKGRGVGGGRGILENQGGQLGREGSAPVPD